MDDIRQGMILGANDYITKPFNIDLLIDSIESKPEKENRKYSEKEKLYKITYHKSFRMNFCPPQMGLLAFHPY